MRDLRNQLIVSALENCTIHDTHTRMLTEKRKVRKDTLEALNNIVGKTCSKCNIEDLKPTTMKMITNRVYIVPVYTNQKRKFISSGLMPIIKKYVRSNVVYITICPNRLEFYVGCKF